MSFSLTGNDIKGPLRWWYTIGAPCDVSSDAPLREREHARIGKLTSLALLIELVEMGIASYAAIEDANRFLPFAFLSVVFALLVALVCNRIGKVKIASVILLVIIEVGMIFTIVGVPNQQLDSFNLQIFALYIQPLLIAAFLFPAWLVFPLAFYHIICICVAISVMPKSPELIAHIHLTPYTAYGVPVTLQVLVALVAFILVKSAYEEMRRAETAEEVNRLTQQIAEYMANSEGQKGDLEHNIDVIQSVLVSVSNGNYQQLVPLTQKDVLWPVALSLNVLINRLRGFREQGLRFEQMNALLAELTRALYQHRMGQANGPFPSSSTGTNIDILTAELQVWLASHPVGLVKQQSFPALTDNPMVTVADAVVLQKEAYRKSSPNNRARL